MDLNNIFNRYDRICPFIGQYAVTLKNYYNFDKSDVFIPNGGCYLYGIVDIDGNEVLPPSYHYIEQFKKCGVARFGVRYSRNCCDVKWGLIKNDGQIVVEPRYFFLEWIDDDKLIAYDDGAIIDERYNYLFLSEWGNKDQRLTSNSKHIIDSKGKNVIDGLFDSVICKPFGYVCSWCDTRDAARPYYSALFDKNGVKMSKEYRTMYWYDDVAIVGNWSFYGLIDSTGKEILPVEYGSIIASDSKSLFAFRKNQEWGLMDKQGTIVLSFEIDEIGPIFNNKFVARVGNKYGVIDLKTGKEILPFIYDLIEMEGNTNNIRIIIHDKKWGLIDSDCEFILPLECEHIEFNKFNDAMNLAKRNGKYGIFDDWGRWIVLPILYDVESTHTWSYYNKQSREHIELNESCVEVRMFNKRMIINRQGTVVYQEDIIDTAEMSSMYIECEWKMQEDASLQSLIR